MPHWWYVYAPYAARVRRHTRIGAAATVASAIVEAVGLGVLGLAALRTQPQATDGVLIALAISGTLILAAVTKALADRELYTGQTRLDAILRDEITDSILRSDWQDFVDQPGHELQSAAIAEAPQVADGTITSVRGKASIAAAVVIFASTFFVSAPAAMISAAFGGLIILAFAGATRGLSGVQLELAESNVQLTRNTSILISGLRSLRLSPIQRRWRLDVQEAFARHAKARSRSLLIPVRARLLVEVLAGLMVLAVLSIQVLLLGSLLPGLIVMALLLRVLPRVQTAQQLLSFARHGAIWVERWERRLGSLHVASEHDTQVSNSNSVATALREHDSIAALELRDVSFAYRGHASSVLEHLDLSIAEGEWVSLRGVSGGGKSTLIDVVAGILLPSSGKVLLNGRELNQFDPQELYEKLIVVPQDVYLVGQTTREIITWGNRLDPTSAPVDDIIAALGIDEMFLFSDTDQDERIDELSRNISGGMRTRLAMARALISNPAVLILDETTSRLHPQAEREILEAIRRLRPDLALLVVTHREETLSMVDRHLRLQAGTLQPE